MLTDLKSTVKQFITTGINHPRRLEHDGVYHHEGIKEETNNLAVYYREPGKGAY